MQVRWSFSEQKFDPLCTKGCLPPLAPTAADAVGFSLACLVLLLFLLCTTCHQALLAGALCILLLHMLLVRAASASLHSNGCLPRFAT